MKDDFINRDGFYSYKDYLSWTNEESWELIYGVPYNMTPAPSRIHQEISMNLSREISNFLKDSSCKAYAAPFDVRLIEDKHQKDEDIKTVVQPDLVVVCDSSKLDEKGCKGSPDFIIEIVSPSSASHDYIRKLRLYEKYKVKEYWIVHSIDKLVMVYHLENDEAYGRQKIYGEDDAITSQVLDGLTIPLKEIFDE